MHNKKDYSPTQAELIGVTITYFQRLEFTISSLLWKLLGNDDDIGRRITTPLSFKNLVTIAANLYSYKFKHKKDYVREFDKLMRRAMKLEDERNLIVHSQFVSTALGRTYSYRLKASINLKRGYRQNFEKYPNEKIREINSEIKKLVKDLVDFLPYTSDKIMFPNN